MITRSTRISRRKQEILLRRFIRKDTAIAAAKEACVNRNTANLYFNHFREKIYEFQMKAPRFNGEVEMDQAFFGKGVRRRTYEQRYRQGDWTPRVVYSKKKNNKVMVFGMYQRGGNVYTRIIEKADRKTLFPIIHMVVEGGATIYTDKWAGFNGLKIDGYTHKSVNHSLGPVGPEGAHTGGIDSFWSFSKGLMYRFRGISRRTFAYHLKECEFRWNHRGKDNEKELSRVLRRII